MFLERRRIISGFQAFWPDAPHAIVIESGSKIEKSPVCLLDWTKQVSLFSFVASFATLS
jgi:hypothetical protein